MGTLLLLVVRFVCCHELGMRSFIVDNTTCPDRFFGFQLIVAVWMLHLLVLLVPASLVMLCACERSDAGVSALRVGSPGRVCARGPSLAHVRAGTETVILSLIENKHICSEIRVTIGS